MKKLLILLISCIMIYGCKKKPAPAPAQPAPAQNNNVNSNLTNQEQQLVGYWIMDSATVYNQNNVKQMSWIYTNTVTCKMDFRNTGLAGYHDVVTGYYQCYNQNTTYSAPNMGEFIIGSQTFPITLITSNRLEFIMGSGNDTWKFYFHK